MSASGDGGWQPIETAPAATGDDDPQVLVWGPKLGAVQMALPDGDWWRNRAAAGFGYVTHWQPLPAPPVSA